MAIKRRLIVVRWEENKRKKEGNKKVKKGGVVESQ